MNGPEKEPGSKKYPKIEFNPNLKGLNKPDNTDVDRTGVEQKFLSETNRLKGDILSEKVKDPDIKNASEKIIGGCLNGATVNKLFLNQEVFQNKETSVYINKALKTHPELWLFMSNLGISNFMHKKYEQLLPSQKMILLALNTTLKGNKAKIDNTKFQKEYANNMKMILSQLQVDFKLTNLSNFGRIKKTLKEDYKLTEIEASKYIAYLEVIKNQPSNVQEAGVGGYLVVAGVSFLLGAVLGIVFYKEIFGPSESQTVIDGKLKLGSPEFIARILSEDVPFESNGIIEKAQYKINPEDNGLEQAAKRILNMAQTRKVVMQVSGKVAIEYDLDNSTMEYDTKTRTMFVRLRSPKTVIHESSSKIIDDNTQIWQTKDFINIPMQLKDSLLNAAKNDVQRNNMLMEQSRKNAEKIFMAIYGYPLSLSGYKLDRIVVEIVDSNGDVIPPNGSIE